MRTSAPSRSRRESGTSVGFKLTLSYPSDSESSDNGPSVKSQGEVAPNGVEPGDGQSRLRAIITPTPPHLHSFHMNAAGKFVAVALTTAAVLVASASVSSKLALTEKRRPPPAESDKPFRKSPYREAPFREGHRFTTESPLAGVGLDDLIEDVDAAGPSVTKDAVRTVTGPLGPTGITG